MATNKDKGPGGTPTASRKAASPVEEIKPALEPRPKKEKPQPTPVLHAVGQPTILHELLNTGVANPLFEIGGTFYVIVEVQLDDRITVARTIPVPGGVDTGAAITMGQTTVCRAVERS